MKRFEVKASKIHGKGLFTRVNLERGDVVGLAVKKGENLTKMTITYIGKWINHGETNLNVSLEPCSQGWALIAVKNIKAGDELVVNYRDAPLLIKRK